MIIDGHTVLRDGHLTTVDEAAVRHASQAAAYELVQRAGIGELRDRQWPSPVDTAHHRR